MNIDRVGSGLAVTGTRPVTQRVDTIVSDEGLRPGSAPTAPATDRVLSPSVTSTPDLQAVLSTAEAAALKAALSAQRTSTAARGGAGPGSSAESGSYAFHGGPRSVTGNVKVGGLVDFSG